MKRFIIFCSFILLTSCATNSHQSHYSVSDEYELVNVGGGALELFPKSDALYASQYIPAKIVEIAWNDAYILAKQTEQTDDPNNPDASITNQAAENYWIIDLKNNRRFGPYTKKQFDEQKHEFRISEQLQLQSVKTYFTKVKQKS
ncbi:DUF3997 domain-containing protein [Bacillus cereus group sp. BfR-BA-01380]|uniref:DUF3997 domain-containing protein n=1 Tax=Bacillus cereus group sp. BfR-BA-01380 TaxID=2920324 RepID=UPI001F55C33E|nr:DUF3997 domain-containing protein [Bacillus cereus group sp. BfR-BA-01380]